MSIFLEIQQLTLTGSDLVVGESYSRSGRSSFSILPAHRRGTENLVFPSAARSWQEARSAVWPDIEGVVLENCGIEIGTGSDRYTIAIFRRCMICPTRAAPTTASHPVHTSSTASRAPCGRVSHTRSIFVKRD